jgi:hypothetical protein
VLQSLDARLKVVMANPTFILLELSDRPPPTEHE